MNTKEVDTDIQPEAAQSNTFTRLLSEFREGDSIAELSEALAQCVKSARETGKAKLIYTMEFKITGGASALVITDTIQTKLTPPEREENIFFVTEENGLSRTNPAQRELDLRTVHHPDREVREVQAKVSIAAQ